MIEDDGGFFRNETRGDPVGMPYFECEKAEECCEDMEVEDVKKCGCKDCTGYLAFVAEMEEAEEEAAMFDAD